ncbi:MAG: hypothetical protein Kow006_22230 [Gammaproteobacteria bacterium]
MSNRHRRCGIVRTSLILLLSSPLLHAADWQPRLEPLPEGEYRSPTTPFEIYIPPEVPLETLKRLALELDAIDVTQFIDNSRAPVYQFRPVQNLSYGKHQLRLLEYTAEGDIVERAVWEVEVRKSRAFREAAYGIDIGLEASRRITQDDDTTDPDRNSASGGIQLNAEVAEGGWRGTGALSVILQEEAEERNAELSDFLFTSSQGGLLVQAGHHAVAAENLVAANPQNRGLSATAVTADQGQNVTGFVFRSAPVSGAKEGLGIGDPDNRLGGVVWNAYPIRETDRYLQISAVYLDGEGPEEGSLSVGDPTTSGGNAWSLSADTAWKNNRFRLRGEYAGSEFDLDTSDPGIAPENDNAFSLLFTYRPWTQKVVDGQPMDLSIHLERKVVGPFFASPAGQVVTSDRDMVRGVVNFGWSGWRIDAGLSREESNVNDIAGLPTDRTDIASAALYYTPLPGDDPERPYGFLGQSSYRLTLTRQTIETLSGGTPFTSSDNVTDAIGLSADFSHPSWSWGIAYDLVDFEDQTNLTEDTRDIDATLQAAFTIGERLSLSPSVQVGRLKSMDTGVETRERRAGLQVAYNPTERWSTHLTLDVNRNRATDDSVDNEVRTVSAGVSWSAVPRGTNRPGVTLTIDGSKTETTDRIDPTLSSESYQVFFKVNVGWSALY